MFIFRTDLQQVDQHSGDIKSSSHGYWFPSSLCSLILPLMTLLPISGTSDLEKGSACDKRVNAKIRLSALPGRDIFLTKCYRSLVSEKWSVCKLKRRHKTPWTQYWCEKYWLTETNKQTKNARWIFLCCIPKIMHFLDILYPTSLVVLCPQPSLGKV